MDKNILIEYADTKEEIKDLRRRIEKGRGELEKLNNMIVTDSVSCGKKGKKPLRTVKIQGKPSGLIERKRKALKHNLYRLEIKETELMELQCMAEEYIESMKKSEMRTMFRIYFIDNLSYCKAAEVMNQMFPSREKPYTDDNIRKRIQRFFEKK